MRGMIAPTILDRLLEPIAGALSPEGARRLIEVRLDSDFQSRLDELASKASAGTLTAEESGQYEQYAEGLDLIAVLKAKARATSSRVAR
jgi:hypothetical protein